MKGRHTYGLLRYLTGPGKYDEHTNPQVLDGSEGVLNGWQRDGQFPDWTRLDLATLATHLESYAYGHLALQQVESAQPSLPDDDWSAEHEPDEMQTVEVPRWEHVDKSPHVLHVILSLGAEEGIKSSDFWGQVARDYLREMGWSDGTRWALFHHGQSKTGNDHVHMVLSAVTEEGTWLNTWNDHKRSSAACRVLERKYGLRELQREGLPGYTHAEARRAGHHDQREGTRTRFGGKQTGREAAERAVRTAATLASNEEEFVETLRDLGVQARPFYTKGGQGVSGYSVVIGTEASGKTIWCGGGKLARDLSLPQLRKRWSGNDPDQAVGTWGASADGRRRMRREPDPEWSRKTNQALWETKQEWERIRVDDRAGARQAMSDLAALLSSASNRVDGPAQALARAARDAARAAQRPGDAEPTNQPVRPANVARAARLMLLASSRKDTAGWLAVLGQLSELMRVTRELQQMQGQRITAERMQRAHQQYLSAFYEEFRYASGAATAATDHEERLASAAQQRADLARAATRVPDAPTRATETPERRQSQQATPHREV